MGRLVFLLPLLSMACLSTIPTRSIDPRVSLPEKLPTLTPCALVHGVVDESLSNGAHGFSGNWKLAYPSFLIRHPQGVVLVDAAFGDAVETDLAGSPFWFRWLFGNTRGVRSIDALLDEAGVLSSEVTHVLVTHAHWDHTGGLSLLPNAKVLVDTTEAEWILASDAHLQDGGMPHHFPDSVRSRLEPVRYPDAPYDGFPGSFDLFGDGSIVAVRMPGHTPGSTGWFVNSGDGKRWLFAGDAAWVKEGVETPAHKGRMAAWLGEWDRDVAAESLGLLHATFREHSAHVVTSHDERTWIDVPRCVNSP